MRPQALQRLFLFWFGLLTIIALFNFYHNLTDSDRETQLENRYTQERQELKSEVDYLKGRIEAPCLVTP